MFERFTERARQVVVLAQEEARMLKHNYIGTEHVLLGLLREEDGIAAMVLESLDVTLNDTRAQVVRIVASGDEESSGQIPFTPRAKKVLELALREALSFGHNWIGPEHILLGLARENEGVAVRILLDAGITSDTIRTHVIRVMSGPGHRPSAEPPHVRVHTPARAGSASSFASASGAAEDAGAMLATIERHIRGLLHRDPDNGDLLVILATLPEGVVARAFADLGIDEAALDAALERARAMGPDAIEDQIELAARLKDEAIDAGDLETAARHRVEERRLTEVRDDDLIGRVRRRLGLMPGAKE